MGGFILLFNYCYNFVFISKFKLKFQKPFPSEWLFYFVFFESKKIDYD